MKGKEVILTEEIHYIHGLYLANLSKSEEKDIKRFFDWFIDAKDSYMQSFYEQVFHTEEIELNPEKLKAVYYFLKENIETRPTTEEEKEFILNQMPEHLRGSHQFRGWTYTEKDFKTIVGLGVFFGELLKQEIEGLKWTTEKDKHMANYGRPILKRPTSKMSIAPYLIMRTYTNKVLQGNWDEEKIMKLYNLWKRDLEQY